MSYLVRPLKTNEHGLPQLCRPTEYEEPNDDYANCDLYSIVAWDHVSWPGNDVYAGARATDDGVKAAPTHTIRVMTGSAGSYDRSRASYAPPADVASWEELVLERRPRIVTHGTTIVVNGGGGEEPADLEEVDYEL